MLCLLAGVAAADEPIVAYAKDVRHALAGWDVRRVIDERDHRDLGPWILRLRITVGADGALRDVTVTQATQLPAFDAEALRVLRAARLPPPPPELVDATMGTFSFPWAFVTPGWSPPEYTGDDGVRARGTRGWEVESSVDVERRTTALAGSAAVASDASYQRTTLTLAASRSIRRGTLELSVPITAIRYREPATGMAADASGFGDAELHLHSGFHYHRWYVDEGAGVSLPTGKTVGDPVAGQIVPAVVQLGTGTFDPLFAGCAGVHLGDANVMLCNQLHLVLYAGSTGYRAPTTRTYRLLGSTSLLCRHASVHAGLLYELRGSGPADGHDELFAEASVWGLVYRGLAVRATLDVPLYERVDGTQLADTVRVMAALSYDFDRR